MLTLSVPLKNIMVAAVELLWQKSFNEEIHYRHVQRITSN